MFLISDGWRNSPMVNQVAKACRWSEVEDLELRSICVGLECGHYDPPDLTHSRLHLGRRGNLFKDFNAPAFPRSSVDVDRIRIGKSIELVQIKLKCVYEVVSIRLAKGEGIGEQNKCGTRLVWTINPPPRNLPPKFSLLFRFAECFLRWAAWLLPDFLVNIPTPRRKT
jgi:hypothetical protein